MSSKRNTEHDAEIIQMFHDGRTYEEIGLAVGYAPGWVFTICKRHGLSRKGPRYYPDTGRVEEAPNGSRRISWSRQMVDDLLRLFPKTLNKEIAEYLGISLRTMIRKARELGLQKDPDWLTDVWEDRRRQAHMVARIKGYPGTIKPGEHRSPDTEFKKRTNLIQQLT